MIGAPSCCNSMHFTSLSRTRLSSSQWCFACVYLICTYVSMRCACASELYIIDTRIDTHAPICTHPHTCNFTNVVLSLSVHLSRDLVYALSRMLAARVHAHNLSSCECSRLLLMISLVPSFYPSFLPFCCFLSLFVSRDPIPLSRRLSSDR